MIRLKFMPNLTPINKQGLTVINNTGPIEFVTYAENSMDNAVIYFIIQHESGKYSEISDYLKKRGYDFSDATKKRCLARLVQDRRLAMHTAGRSTSYKLTVFGRLFFAINAHDYCAIDPDARHGQSAYNFDLFPGFPTEILTPEERRFIESSTVTYRQRSAGLSPVLQHKELERFIIELSWKSAKIEGNTYTLLDTERLIKDGIPSEKNTAEETAMILNHKTAFQEIMNGLDGFRVFSLANLERLHALLVSDLGVSTGLRRRAVGITGSVYRPLDNDFQLREAVTALAGAIARADNGADKALMAVLGISYIQPFEDGNKRTARMMANAILLAHGLAPLSYRSVTEEDYRETILVFYELNSLVPFKNIFVEQYVFAAKNYAVPASPL
jgi:fido (protein-threonine AMPylation protein)